MEMGRQGLFLQEQTWVCIPSAGEHYPGVPAKIPLGGQTEEQLWHPAAGGDAEMVVPGEMHAQGQEGMSASTAPPALQRGYSAMLPALCRNALLPATEICTGVPSTVKYCSCATARYSSKTF